MVAKKNYSGLTGGWLEIWSLLFPFAIESVIVEVGIVYLDNKSSVLSCPIDGGSRIFRDPAVHWDMPRILFMLDTFEERKDAYCQMISFIWMRYSTRTYFYYGASQLSNAVSRNRQTGVIRLDHAAGQGIP